MIRHDLSANLNESTEKIEDPYSQICEYEKLFLSLLRNKVI